MIPTSVARVPSLSLSTWAGGLHTEGGFLVLWEVPLLIGCLVDMSTTGVGM